jgi:hypothetical protein
MYGCHMIRCMIDILNSWESRFSCRVAVSYKLTMSLGYPDVESVGVIESR